MATTTTNRSSTRLLAVVVSLLASLLLLPATASAQPDSPVDDPAVEGTGALWARGDGTAEIDMAGRYSARVTGDVTIIDHAGDLKGRIQFGGQGRTGADRPEFEESIGDTVLSDFDGWVHLRGSDFTVIVDGEVGLRAVGSGQAFLTGEGTYRTRHGDRTVWSGMVTLGDPQVEAP